jgi:serine/threonine protein kinase
MPKATATVDADDMFSDTPTTKGEAGEADEAAAGGDQDDGRAAATGATAQRTADDWDDTDGYYKHEQGEVLATRYQVIGLFGKGVFSTVLRARDVLSSGGASGDENLVALKMVRANPTMAKAAEKEEAVLRRIEENDKQGRRHCVRLLSRFEHRGHLVFAFEAMSMNLRSVVHKYGKSVGLHIGGKTTKQ